MIRTFDLLRHVPPRVRSPFPARGRSPASRGGDRCGPFHPGLRRRHAERHDVAGQPRRPHVGRRRSLQRQRRRRAVLRRAAPRDRRSGTPRDSDRWRRRAARLARSPGRRWSLHRARRHRLRVERSRAPHRDREVSRRRAARRRAPAAAGRRARRRHPVERHHRHHLGIGGHRPVPALRRRGARLARGPHPRGARRTPAARTRPRRVGRPQVADGRNLGAAAPQLLARHRRRRLLPGDALPGDEGPRVPGRRARRRRLPESDRQHRRRCMPDLPSRTR